MSQDGEIAIISSTVQLAVTTKCIRHAHEYWRWEDLHGRWWVGASLGFSGGYDDGDRGRIHHPFITSS